MMSLLGNWHCRRKTNGDQSLMVLCLKASRPEFSEIDTFFEGQCLPVLLGAVESGVVVRLLALSAFALPLYLENFDVEAPSA